jgi:enterochelin esterase-like enzyme
LNRFRAAGLVLIFMLSACSESVTIGEESPLPTSTLPITTAPAATEATPEITETAIPSITAQVRSCSEASGEIEIYEIPWKEEILTGRIYLPPCYGQDPDLDYPTLYILHGATGTDQQWDDLGLDEWADTLILEKEISPLIIIMPREITWIILPENPFGDHLITAVIPWIDSHYQTLENRDYRAIGGMSRGGNWAVRLGLLHWGLFGSIGAHSTPLFIGDLKRVPGWIEIIPASHIPRILMDIGEDDNNLADAQALHESLLDLDLPHEWRLYPGLHDEHYWRSHLEEYLKWFSEGWTEQ